MGKVIRAFCWHQHLCPKGMSAPAPCAIYMYTSIKIYTRTRWSLVLWLEVILITQTHLFYFTIGPHQANLVHIAYASSEASGQPAHLRSLTRTSAARSYKQWVKRNLQTENQIPGPSELLGMRSLSLSWRNARRHKFAWRATIVFLYCYPCHIV